MTARPIPCQPAPRRRPSARFHPGSPLLRLGLLLLGLTLGVTSPTQAKDLRGRLALGLDSQFTFSSGLAAPAALSLKYTLPAPDKTINIQLQAFVGAEVLDLKQVSLVTGARFLYPVVAEDNMNLFVGLGAAFLRDARGEDPVNGVLVQPMAGAEFFLFGLENLGFTAALGINAEVAGQVNLSTAASSFGNVSIHYYF